MFVIEITIQTQQEYCIIRTMSLYEQQPIWFSQAEIIVENGSAQICRMLVANY